MEKDDSLLRFTLWIIVIIGLGWILSIGSTLIVPIIYSIVLAVFLNPLEKKLRKKLKIKWLTITLSFLTLIIPFVIISGLFSIQLVSIVESIPSIGDAIGKGIDKLITKVHEIIPLFQFNKADIIGGENQNITEPLKALGKGLASTTSILASLGMTFIYAFLFLYYKESFNNFLIYQFSKRNRPEVKEAIAEIKDTIQAYIGGLGIVIVILSIANSIGLWLIGIEHAIFWGVLAGILAVIPYIGTLLGGLLPFLFALSTSEYSWQPIAVIFYYLIIQQIEGNFITPKIIGEKVDINPLFAILSLVFFGSFWGIGGVILALPIISIVKIILSNFPETAPYAILMSSDVTSKKGEFKEIADYTE
jgi:predicted PurR-regulated permease PerM